MKMFFAILIILVGVYLLYNEFNFSWFGDNDDSKSADISNVQRIDIDVSGINTKIVPEQRNDLKVVLRGKGDLELDHTGDEIRVKYRKGWFNWFPFGRTNLTIYMPRDYDRELILDNGSGSLTMIGPSKNDPLTFKSMLIDMSSGNLNLENVHAESFVHEGSSGNVDINYLKTGSGNFEVSSGNVRIKHYSGELKADLSSGNFNVQMDKLIGDVEVELSSGSVDLSIPEDADFTLKGKANSGNINCNFPLKNQTADNRRVEGSYGSGEYLIDLSVNSGNIKVH